MSIAKKLAGGGSFQTLAQGEARGSADATARSQALDTTGRVRRSSLAPVSSIVFNPLNPRKTIVDESIAELAQSLSRHQVVPLTVVSREAFLDAHPEQASALGGADFVALDGNRRLLAAQRAGLTSLRVDLNDDLVASAADMVEAALVANAHREGVPPFEEAQAIEQLLTTVYAGNQAAVARRLGKSAAWVGQRLALLHLTPELQEQAGSGDLPIEEARKIGAEARAGKLTATEQRDRASAAKQAAQAKQHAKSAARAERALRAPRQPQPAAAADAADAWSTPGAPTGADALTTAEEGAVGLLAVPVPPQADAPAHTDTVAVRFDPSDAAAAAHILRGTLSARQAAQLVLELLAILQAEPHYQEVADLIRSEGV
jgi:ParB family chromosome partitioning protein